MSISSNSFPNPKNPLVLKYKNHVPALKNRRQMDQTDEGVKFAGKNAEVRKYLRNISASLMTQWEKSGFDMMKNIRVGAWVDIYFFGKGDLVKSDADNSYTTIQETWQLPNSRAKSAGIVGAIYDDRQIVQGTFNMTTTPIRSLEGATAYLWAISSDTPAYQQLMEFLMWYHEQQGKEVEYTEIPNLLAALLEE